MSFEYTLEQFNERYEAIKENVTVGKNPVDFPTAYILGGQPGAGKSRLQKQILLKNLNCIIINADAYREYHPMFSYIQSFYGDDSPKYTQPFINQVTERLIDDLSNEHYNLVVEGTLRTAEVPIDTCRFLKHKGYSVELHIISVKPEISYESTILRYEYALSQDETPRATDKRHHDMVVDNLVENLQKIERSCVFDLIKLFNRFGKCVFISDGSHFAHKAEQKILFGKWSHEEYNELKRLVAEITRLKDMRNAADLSEYLLRSSKMLADIKRRSEPNIIR